MSEQSRSYDEWLDGIAEGRPVDAGEFARSAIGDLPRVETPIRYPSNQGAWPPEIWAEIEAIRKGER